MTGLHMRSRTIAAALALAALAAGLVGCGAKDNGGTIGGAVSRVSLGPAGALHDRLPARVLAAGVLKVGVAVGRAPLLFYATGTATPEGIDFELLQAMGRQLGVKIAIVNDPLVQLGPDVLAGRIDAFTSGFVDLKGFEGAGIDFVDDMTGRSSVVVRQANPAKVHGPDDLCGRTVGLVSGTAQELAAQHLSVSCVTRHRPKLVVHGGGDHAALLVQLTGGSLDAVLDDSIVAAYTAQESIGATTVKVVGAAVDPVPYGIGVARTNPQLRDALQAALVAIIHDGEYDGALAHWGGTDGALRSAAINTGP